MLNLQRSGASRVLPYLYLGGELDAANREKLIELNVTALLNCAYPQVDNHFVSDVNWFSCYWVQLFDDGNEDVIQYFKRCWEFLDEMREEGRVLMIHCKSGNSRSAVMCMGYLMHHLNLSFKEAYYLVKKSRPSINPQQGFLEQLVKYEFFLSHLKEMEDEQKKREREQAALERQLQRQMDREMGLLDEDEDKEGGKGKEKEKEADVNEEEAKENEEDEDNDANTLAKRQLFLANVNRVRQAVPPLVDITIQKSASPLHAYITRLLETRQWDELSNTCSSLASVPLFANLVRKSVFQFYKGIAPGVSEGLKKKNAGKPANFVQACHEWIDQQVEGLRQAFGADKKQGIERAFRHALSYFVDPSARQFAGCCSALAGQLGKGKVSAEHVSAEFEKILLLLCYMRDPQAIGVFMGAYANAMAERLIQRTDGDAEHVEELFIGLMDKRLFDEAKPVLVPPYLPGGFARFILELRNMLKDAVLSAEALRTEKKERSLLSCRVISSRLWPMTFLSGGASYSQASGWRGLDQKKWVPPCMLPSSAQHDWATFREEYGMSHPRNKIQLVPHLGEADMKMTFGKLALTVTVSTPMMIILDLFNDLDTLSCQQIIEATNLTEKDAKQALYSLACVTYPKPSSGTILLHQRNPEKEKEEKEKESSSTKVGAVLIENEDTFTFNPAFHTKWRKIEIPTHLYPPRAK